MTEKEARLIDANALVEMVNQEPTDGMYTHEIISLIEEQPTIDPESLRPQWISVKDRLPEKKSNILMLFEFGNMAVGYWHDGDEDCTFWCAYTDNGFYTDCDSEPTHWMPLPEPPKED